MEDLRSFRLHAEETRPQNQIELTNLLARSLTQLNLQRIRRFQTSTSINNKSNRGKQDYLYVCFTGLPAFVNEFDTMGIPGEKIVIYPIGFEPGQTEQQTKQKLQFAQVQKQAGIIHEKLKNRTDKQLVFIYHSFGTTLISALLKLYYIQYIDRIIGMIAIGCYTIRAGNFFNYIDVAESFKYKGLLENIDDLYTSHLESSRTFKFAKSPNKFANIASLVAFGKGMGFSEMFDYNRRWPPVLKCFIYGRQDNRIEQPLLNQTAIYYAFKRKFSQDYQDKIRNIFATKYGLKLNNIQQRFIYNIQDAKHSLHIQKRHQPIIKSIIAQYLSVIQSVHSI